MYSRSGGHAIRRYLAVVQFERSSIICRALMPALQSSVNRAQGATIATSVIIAQRSAVSDAKSSPEACKQHYIEHCNGNISMGTLITSTVVFVPSYRDISHGCMRHTGRPGKYSQSRNQFMDSDSDPRYRWNIK